MPEEVSLGKESRSDDAVRLAGRVEAAQGAVDRVPGEDDDAAAAARGRAHVDEDSRVQDREDEGARRDRRGGALAAGPSDGLR